MTLLVPQVIILESFLSFLGLGVQEPMSSWGVLIAQGAKNIGCANWLLLFPSFFLTTTLFALNFIGDGLRDAFDPQGPLGRVGRRNHSGGQGHQCRLRNQ